MVQVIACAYSAPSYYLNQWWNRSFRIQFSEAEKKCIVLSQYILIPILLPFFQAHQILDANFAPTVLAMGAMVAMSNYAGILQAVGSVSIPILFGEPMSGKTLAATCASFILGSNRTQIYSRWVQLTTELGSKAHGLCLLVNLDASCMSIWPYKMGKAENGSTLWTSNFLPHIIFRYSDISTLPLISLA